MLKFSINEMDSRGIVNLVGDLDIEATEIINDDLIPCLLDFQMIQLNFEHVPFVDSSGMGLLLNIVKRLKEQNIEVTISDVKEEVYEVFDLLQIPEIVGEETFV